MVVDGVKSEVGRLQNRPRDSPSIVKIEIACRVVESIVLGISVVATVVHCITAGTVGHSSLPRTDCA